MIRIPLSVAGPAAAFAAALEQHRAAVEAQMMGKPGVPAPVHFELDQLIRRVPDAGPVAERGPDQVVILPYEIFDDTPIAPDVQQALDVLRESISG